MCYKSLHKNAGLLKAHSEASAFQPNWWKQCSFKQLFLTLNPQDDGQDDTHHVAAEKTL